MLFIKNLYFSYHTKEVLKNINFSIATNSITAIIGQSGCGKSTLLKLIYGFYDLSQGQIIFNNKVVLGPKFNLIPGLPEMKYLAQNLELMPFTSVAENVGAFLSNINQEAKKNKILELLQLVDMINFAHVKVKNLSGGQQQRVALARTLALEPSFLLLDEPFSQIDRPRKNSLQQHLFDYLKSKNIGCLFATHDTTDALAFAQETIVMQSGKILIKDNTKLVYQKPLNQYVASLFDEVNAIPKKIIKPLDTSGEVLLVYPHQLKITKKEGFKAVVVAVFFKGSHYLIKAEAAFGFVYFNHHNALEVEKIVVLCLNRLNF